MWKIWYKGVPKVCFKCFKEGHFIRDFQEEQVLADTMGTLTGIGEEEEISVEQQEERVTVSKQFTRTFAQVLKEQNYKAL